ncbi:glycosyltransferase family 39 protein [Microbacterium pumilum]|uniref:Glycosyltransferase family 39 protein n=2 Tax=Microbacterium pumilum TaxID=344165 RepID=A0ABN2SPD7_9MICO
MIAVLGVAGGVLVALGIGVPSFWGDEAASVMSAQRPLPSLLGELTHVDAVHGLYYVLLHFWIGVAGTSETAVRFPSAVAAGFAIAGTAALARELFGDRVALLSGMAAIAIPELTRMAIEARSYAPGMAAAVWLTWLLVRLAHRGETRRRMWALYAIGTGLSIVLFIYLGLMLFVHAVVILVSRPSRTVVTVWVRSVVAAVAIALPVLLLSLAQQRQIAFLAHRHYATPANVLVRQWFTVWPVAAIAWTLILAGAVAMLRRTAQPRTRGNALIIWAWLILPTTLLLIGNAWVHPMYNMRYVAFCVPAVAICIALSINGLTARAKSQASRRLITGALVITLLIAAIPTFTAQRTPFAKDGGSDLRQIATTVRQHASAGDAVIFDESVKPRLKPRLALDLYPGAFTGLDDIALRTRAADHAALWDSVRPLDAITAAVVAHHTVWAVESGHGSRRDLDVLEALGYHITETYRLHRTTLFELEKEPS